MGLQKSDTTEQLNWTEGVKSHEGKIFVLFTVVVTSAYSSAWHELCSYVQYSALVAEWILQPQREWAGHAHPDMGKASKV